MATLRKQLSKRTRFEVFKRDGFMCCYCGAHPPEVVLEVDHIKPVSRGGSNDIDNLAASCEACNRGKSNVALTSVPVPVAKKAAALAEAEAQLEGYQELQRARRDRIESECWEVADLLVDHFNTSGVRKADFQSIKTFVQRLGVFDVIDSMEKAISSKPYSEMSCFRYFCGICWKKIKVGQV